MIESTFMTTYVWELKPYTLLKGYLFILYLKDNLDWWYIEITDGFRAYHNSLVAMELRAENKYLSLKEEVDSSRVNQAYNKFVARGDKESMRGWLIFFKSGRCKISYVIDQWALVHAVLQCVKDTKLSTWTKYFDTCNLDPSTRVDFKRWRDRISSYLMVGQTFKKEEDVTVHEIYDMIPTF